MHHRSSSYTQDRLKKLSEQIAYAKLKLAKLKCKRSREFYEKVGFKTVAVLPNNFLGHDAYILIKSLK